MKNPSAKQLIFVTIVIFVALALMFSLILRNSFDFRGLSLKEMPGRRSAYDSSGKALPFEPMFMLASPIELARTPLASRFDSPIGSEHGALAGDKVYAVAAGRVIASSKLDRTIAIAHRRADGSLFQTVYANLQGREVDVGTDVLRGELIGYLESPGQLSFETRDSVSANPAAEYFGEPVGIVRGAPDDFVNPAPRELQPELEIPWSVE